MTQFPDSIMARLLETVLLAGIFGMIYHLSFEEWEKVAAIILGFTSLVLQFSRAFFDRRTRKELNDIHLKRAERQEHIDQLEARVRELEARY